MALRADLAGLGWDLFCVLILAWKGFGSQSHFGKDMGGQQKTRHGKPGDLAGIWSGLGSETRKDEDLAGASFDDGGMAQHIGAELGIFAKSLAEFGDKGRQESSRQFSRVGQGNGNGDATTRTVAHVRGI